MTHTADDTPPPPAPAQQGWQCYPPDGASRPGYALAGEPGGPPGCGAPEEAMAAAAGMA